MKRGKDYIGVAVGIILVKDNKVLVIKRAREPYKNWWALPGGSVEIGETTKKTVIRETKEELGIDIKPKFLFIHQSFDKRKDTHYVEFWFSAPFKEIILNSEEISDSKLIELEELSKIDLAFTHNEVVKKYLKS